MSRFRFVAIGLCSSAISIQAGAHHSRISFSDDVLAFQATVTRVDWANPHVYIYAEATIESGELFEWEIETQSTPNLIRRGWSANSLQAGDVVTIRANPDRNPDKRRLFGMTFTTSDGTVYSSQGSAGRIVVGEVPGAESLMGIWETADWSGAGPRDSAATHLPLTEKALAAAARFTNDHNPMLQCIPGIPPGNMGGPYLHRVTLGDDVVAIYLEYNGVTRTVYTDGREHPADLEHTNQGHSIGWWEGDVLVVDTVGMADHRWGTGRGIPSGAQRHVVERFTLGEDGATARVDYFVEDPEYLTEPVTGTVNWRHAPHLEVLPYDCDPEVSSRHVADN
jgi:hypothetical protein